jgi:membrane protein
MKRWKAVCAMQNVWILIKETFAQWSEDKAARLGAALAYYAVFSIGPLLVVVTALAGLFFGQEAVRGEVTGALKDLLGDAGATGIEAMLAQASQQRQGSLALAIGAATLVFGAVGVVVQLKDALNTIWDVDARKESGAWAFIRAYVISTAAVLALAFLLLISMLFAAAVSALGGLLFPGVGAAIAQTFNLALNFVAMTLIFAMMFKWLPDVEVAWKDVVIGAMVTALLFTIGHFLIGLYLGATKAESAFGASASLVVVLVWVYYTAQIVFLGAEFTQVFARHYGSLAGQKQAMSENREEAGPPRQAPPVTRATAAVSLIAAALAWYEHRRAPEH